MPVGREGIGDARPLRAVAALAEAEKLAEIVGGAGGEEVVEHREVALLRPGHDPPAQRRAALAGLRPADELLERARQPFGVGLLATAELRGLDRVEVAPPSVAIAPPL